MKQKKNIGRVASEERDIIRYLYEHKNGLLELAKVLTADNAEIYEKVVQDLGQTNIKYQQWWDSMADKYGWEKIDDGRWEIDFESCEVFLVEE